MRVLTLPNLDAPNSIQLYEEEILQLVRLTSSLFEDDDTSSLVSK